MCDKRCKECKHYYIYHEKEYCTRFPKWENLMGVFNSDTHWCGEYVSKHNEPFECKCDECIINAPYRFCCKKECGEHEFCKGCNADQ